jgi:hypothetical protein
MIWMAFGIVAAVLAWVFYSFFPHAPKLGISVILFLFLGCKVVIAVMDSKIVGFLREFRGEAAEERIGEILNQLEGDHWITPEVQCPFGNIDRIVFSKNHGVFLIETKGYHGNVEVVDSRIRVNGKLPEQDFIAQMLRKTHWLAEELQAAAGVSVKVNSLLVFTNAFVVTSRSIKGITVTNNKFLLASIHQQARPLAAEVWEAKDKIAGQFAATSGASAN